MKLRWQSHGSQSPGTHPGSKGANRGASKGRSKGRSRGGGKGGNEGSTTGWKQVAKTMQKLYHVWKLIVFQKQADIQTLALERETNVEAKVEAKVQAN